MKTIPVVLAAGQGTRMNSATPKVLHPLLGHPLVWYSLESSRQATGERPVLVIGHAAEAVRQAVGEAAQFVLQQPQLGTGHAVQQAEALLHGNTDFVLVTYADMPLLTAETLRRVIWAHSEQHARHPGATPITMLTVLADDPRGFGRVVRNADGTIRGIVEEAQATPEQLSIRELNPGVYCFTAEWLWQALRRVPLSPKGEYYLTDAVGLAVSDGLSVQPLVAEDPNETIGINTRIHLAEATTVLRRRINQNWMLSGVTLIDPDATYIEPEVGIGQDTVIWPNTYLYSKTIIGEACTLGPNTIIHDARIGNRCEILASVIEKAIVEDDVEIGPFARLRKGAHLAQGVHMGNFGEVKNSYLGPGVKIGHFSYVGDATIGANANVSAGVITCNFDGRKKNHTEIGADAFIGSDTLLIAPVAVGEGARTGAGAVVTKDIPPYSLAVGMPARVIRRLNPPES